MHKFNCSTYPFASDGSKLPTTELEINEEFHSEVARLREIVDNIARGINELNGERGQMFGLNRAPLPTELFEPLQGACSYPPVVTLSDHQH